MMQLLRVSNQEHWFLTKSGSASASVTLYAKDLTFNGISDFAGLAVAHFDELSDNHWENYATGANWVRADNVSVFSPFTFGTTVENNTLPVEFVFVNGTLNDRGVMLKWSTAVEIKKLIIQ